MKKTILTSAIVAAMASGSVFADVNVYDENGVNVMVGGAAEVQLYQAFDFDDGEDIKKDIRLDDGNLHFDTKVQLNDDVKALAFFDFDFEAKEVTNSDLYVGFESMSMGTIKAGRTISVYDDTGVSEDIELGVTSLKDEKFDKDSVKTYTSGDDVIRYDYDMGAVYFAIATNIESKEGAASWVDGKIGVKGENFDVRAFAQQGEAGLLADEMDTKAYAVEASVNMNKLGLNAGYYVAENDMVTGEEEGYNTVSVSATYAMESVTLAGGANFVNGINDLDEEESDNYYVNVTKKLHDNVTVYGEIGVAHVNGDDATGYLAGMEVKF